MFTHNLKIAWRNLLKYKLQTSISIISLTVGMICFALSALWFRYESSYDSWWPDYDDIYMLQCHNGEGYALERGYSEYMTFTPGQHLRETIPGIELLSRISQSTCTLKQTDKPENEFWCGYCMIDEGVQEMLGIKVIEGRKKLVLNEDEAAITRSTAERLFPGENALGQKVEITQYGESRGLNIVAIIEDPQMPSSFPYGFVAGFTEEWKQNGTLGTACFVKIRHENLANVSKALEKVVIQYGGGEEWDEEDHVFRPLTSWSQEFSFKLVPLSEMRESTSFVAKVVEQNHLRLFVILGIVVICCALSNYFTMLITRIRIRRHELALRYVNGAMMGDLITLMSTELILILLFSTLLSVGIVSLTIEEFKSVCCIQQPYSFFIGWFLIYALAAAFASMAITATIIYYCNRKQLHQALDKHRQPIARLSFFTAHTVLLGVQLAVSICAIFCSSVMMHQISFLLNSPDMGFAKHNRGVVNFSRRTDGSEGFEHARILEKELKQWPELEEVLVDYKYPIPNGYQSTLNICVNGEDNIQQFLYTEADEHYFRFMDIQMVDGEIITTKDDESLVCINESAARLLGKQGRIGGTFDVKEEFTHEHKSYTVKGIFKDLSYTSPLTPTQPMVFIPRNPIREYDFWEQNLVRWKEGTDLAALNKKIEDLHEKLFPGEEVSIWFMSAEVEYESYLHSEHTLSHLLMLVTAVCVLIAIFGIFSMLSLACERRRKEIAIRKVHGAKTGTIMQMFLREYMCILLASALIAFPVGYYLMHLWLSQYAKQAPVYWWIYPVILVFMALLVFLTIYWQIRKAAMANPTNLE